MPLQEEFIHCLCILLRQFVTSDFVHWSAGQVISVPVIVKLLVLPAFSVDPSFWEEDLSGTAFLKDPCSELFHFSFLGYGIEIYWVWKKKL